MVSRPVGETDLLSLLSNLPGSLSWLQLHTEIVLSKSLEHSLYRGSCTLSQFYSLCNFDATFLRGWSEDRPRRYVFHSAKLPTIQILFGGKLTTCNYPCIGYGGGDPSMHVKMHLILCPFLGQKW